MTTSIDLLHSSAFPRHTVVANLISPQFHLRKEREGGCWPAVGGTDPLLLYEVQISPSQRGHLCPCLPHPELCTGCQSLDHNQPPLILKEDFYFPAEWKQLKPQKLPHSEFLQQFCSHGSFQRAFNSLESKNIPWILIFIRNGQWFPWTAV